MKRIIKISVEMILALLLITSCKKNNMNISNPGYAIGTIVYYRQSASHVNPGISYTFLVDSKTYGDNYTSGSFGRPVPPSNDYKKGDMFMVQYQLGKIDENRMLFNYAVTDSADYKGYVEEFKTASPRLK